MKKIQINTTIPGKNSEKALANQCRRESTAITYPKKLPLSLECGKGSYVKDVDGNVFLDFLSGAGSLPLGHSHEELTEAVIEQTKKLCLGLDFPTPAKDSFSDAHLSMLPKTMQQNYRIHFCGPTGADAIEAAIKLAKLATGAEEIISFRGSYHGCTNGALSLTGNRVMKQNIPNRMPGVHFFPFGSTSTSIEKFVLNSSQVDAALLIETAMKDANSGLGKVAAIILELVQGEGGVYVADKDFVKRIRQLCNDENILLIVDEIQTGCGRTGTWYSFEQYDIEPDIFVTSKGTSGIGLPSSLMFYHKNLTNWPSGSHIGTFRGNQLSFAAGAKFIEIINRESILENVKQRSQQLIEGLTTLKKQIPVIGEIRGLGLMLGIEVLNPETGQACSKTVTSIQNAALNNGLIIELGGRDDTILRILPPLNINANTASEALFVLEKAILSCAINSPKLEVA